MVIIQWRSGEVVEIKITWKTEKLNFSGHYQMVVLPTMVYVI